MFGFGAAWKIIINRLCCATTAKGHSNDWFSSPADANYTYLLLFIGTNWWAEITFRSAFIVQSLLHVWYAACSAIVSIEHPWIISDVESIGKMDFTIYIYCWALLLFATHFWVAVCIVRRCSFLRWSVESQIFMVPGKMVDFPLACFASLLRFAQIRVFNISRFSAFLLHVSSSSISIS